MNRMPVYIKIENYEDVLDLLGTIKKKLDDAKNTFGRIQELKAQEDAKLAEWEAKLRDVSGKLERVDNSLGEPNE